MRRSSSISTWGLIVFAALAALGTARGQELSILHSFAGNTVSPSDAATPRSVPVQDSTGTSYGTTTAGGSAGHGTVYTMAPNGTITILHSFGAAAVPYGGSTVPDGTIPTGNLILANDGNLYGTTADGGASYGTVYRISTAGVYSVIYLFAAQNSIADPAPQHSPGVYPESGVIQGHDGSLYGTASEGGDFGTGVVFRLSLDGSAYTVLHSFAATVNNTYLATNDAAYPWLALVQDAQGNFYGATTRGGSADAGAIYELDSQSQYSIIYNFPAPSTSFTFALNSSYAISGSGSYSPNSALVIGVDGNLYGTASSAIFGAGAVYQVTPLGAFTVVHAFGDGSVTADGAEPIAPVGPAAVSAVPPVLDQMILASDGNFYGATPLGGAGNKGVIFQLTPTGQFTIIHAFGDGTLGNDGAHPVGLIQGTDGNFYGTTSAGGAAGFGTFFKITTDLPLFTSPLRLAAAVGNPLTYQMVATQGPNTFSVSGLQDGFSFDGTSVISATPTQVGTFTLMLTATNAAGSSTVPLVITVQAPPVITSLLNVVGSTFGLAYQIRATSNPTSFAATDLPPGVTLDPVSGIFHGTPAAAGTYPVTISATNAIGTGTAAVTLEILSSAPTSSQEYALIHNFQDGSVSGEGSYPGSMILGTDGTFYGVTAQGGANGGGTIFNLSSAGTAQVLASLGGANGSEPQGLVQTPDGTLWGTTASGGSANEGTIFKVTLDGTVTLLHTFGDTTVTNDGAAPQGGLVLASDGNFYGTTQYGGSFNLGTVYQMTPSGGVTILHSFGSGTVTNFGGTTTTTDGAQPVVALVQAPGLSMGGGISLIGTTLLGGAQNVGTLFGISSTGNFIIYHSFGDPTVTNDGQLPHGALFTPGSSGLHSFTFYGTTTTGGSIGKGTVYSFQLTGSAMAILHSFGDGTVASDGENPNSALSLLPPATISSGGLTLCGTTQNGGTAGFGTVFSCSISGTSATTAILHNCGDFAFPNDGTIPMAGVCLGPDGNIYGTTIGGGDGSGTAFVIETNQTSPFDGTVASAWTCTGTIPAGLTFDGTTGQLSGTPVASARGGVYSLTISNVSGNVITSTQTVTFNLTQTFTSWMNAHAANRVGGSSSSTGADGVPLLLKYLFDASAANSMTASDHAAMPAVGLDSTSVSGKDFVALAFRENPAMTGVTVTLESSDDLQNWTTVPPANLLSQQIGTDATTGDPIMEMGAQSDGSPHQYVRLNVTGP